jgi:hypothetical protein
MAIGTGLFVMTGAFVLVWLVFVVFSEITIARDRRDERETEAGERRA